MARSARVRQAGDELPDLSQYGRLAEYRTKRRFDVTPEPPPRLGTRRARSLEFVVQKHRAGHLHYDFRLEHEGVMLSWAVPKGPSPDPSVRRLAMQTEPHPMDYNQFEGVIPEGEYGGGTVMIWDRGTWEPQSDDVGRALGKGDLKFTLHGKKLGGSWVLVRTRDRNWLLIKHRDEFASADDLTVAKPRSVVSRRTLAGIARAAGASARQLEQAAAADPPRDRVEETSKAQSAETTRRLPAGGARGGSPPSNPTKPLATKVVRSARTAARRATTSRRQRTP